MRLVPDRLEAVAADGSLIGAAPCTTDGSYRLGPLVVTVEGLATWGDAVSPPPLRWSVANAAEVPVRPWIVRLVTTVEHRGPVRMFRHGYQSWSACDVAIFGVDDDPSRSNPTGIELVQGVHHADQRTAAAGELRSEFVTVLRDDGDPAAGVLCVGFAAGTGHDGTFRLRPAAEGAVSCCVEAFLGGARLDPGVTRNLHELTATVGQDAAALLAGWARQVGHASGARTQAPFQVGWCSWYHYFHGVTEDHLRTNLAASDRWPFEVFQLDDGYQSAIGDWLTTNAKFPSSIDVLADAIAASGRTPGIWLAPFIAAPDSEVARRHPEWMMRTPGTGGPLPGMFNEPWGGGMGGIMFALDTTHPEVQDHLADVARQLRSAGYDYLKLDFTFSPSFDGEVYDDRLTPAERVRAGYDAIRRGAGDDAFLLGCGAPIGPVVGVIDGNRIGSDVDPRWTLDPARAGEAYPDTLPATVHAFRNTLARSFMHRHLWLNDPDCVMLRTTETDLDPAAVRTWAETVGVSGGMVLVSDDLALLDGGARDLLENVIALGRQADAEALAGRPAACPDLLDATPPTTLLGAGRMLVVDPVTGHGGLIDATDSNAPTST
jgi:alpha-galactosidase